jgi:hypothetical protein
MGGMESGERQMTAALEIVALLLPRDDREVVLGDLEEQKQPNWFRLFAILGFVARQQAEYWRDWRAWMVGGAVIPATLLLLGASFRLSMDFRTLWQAGYVGDSLFYQAALTIVWAWTSGFLLGSLSWRTGWVSALLCVIPCLRCLLEFREPSLSSFCLFLFIPPGLMGAVLGRHWRRLGLAPAVVLALTTASIMLLWHGMPASNWLLFLPALYLALTSGKRGQLSEKAFS